MNMSPGTFPPFYGRSANAEPSAAAATRPRTFCETIALSNARLWFAGQYCGIMLSGLPPQGLESHVPMVPLVPLLGVQWPYTSFCWRAGPSGFNMDVDCVMVLDQAQRDKRQMQQMPWPAKVGIPLALPLVALQSCCQCLIARCTATRLHAHGACIAVDADFVHAAGYAHGRGPGIRGRGSRRWCCVGWVAACP